MKAARRPPSEVKGLSSGAEMGGPGAAAWQKCNRGRPNCCKRRAAPERANHPQHEGAAAVCSAAPP